MQHDDRDVLLEAVDATPCMPAILANLPPEGIASRKNPLAVRHGEMVSSAPARTRNSSRRTASGATVATTVNELTSFTDYFADGEFSQPPWQCSSPVLLAAFVAVTLVVLAGIFDQLGLSAIDEVVNWEARARNAHVAESLAIQFLGRVINVERSVDFLTTVIAVSAMACNVTEDNGERVLPWMQIEANCSDITWAYPPLAPWATNLSYLSHRRASLQELTWGVFSTPTALQSIYDAATTEPINSTTADAAQRFLLMSVHDAEWVLPYGSTMYSLLSCVLLNSSDEGRSAALEVIFPSGNYLSLWCGGADDTSDEIIGMSSFALLPAPDAPVNSTTSSGGGSTSAAFGLFREVTCPRNSFYDAVAWLTQFLSCTTVDCCAVVESRRPPVVHVTFRRWSATEFNLTRGTVFTTLADAVVGEATNSEENGFVSLSTSFPGDGFTRKRALWRREALLAPAAATQWWTCKGVALSATPSRATTGAVCALMDPWECETTMFTDHDSVLHEDNFVVAIKALGGGRAVAAAGVVNGTLATVPLVNSSWCLNNKSTAAVKIEDSASENASSLPRHLEALLDGKPLERPPSSWCAWCGDILPLRHDADLASTPLEHAASIAAFVDHLSTADGGAAFNVARWRPSTCFSRLSKTNGIVATDPVVIAPPSYGIEAFSVIWVDPVAVLLIVGSLAPAAPESHRLTIALTQGGVALVVVLLTYALAFWVTYPLRILKSAARESDAKVVHAVARASWADHGEEVPPPEDVGAAIAQALEDSAGTSDTAHRLRHAGVTLPNTTEWNSILSISCIEVCSITSLYAWVRHLSQLSVSALQTVAAVAEEGAATKDRHHSPVGGEWRLREGATVPAAAAAAPSSATADPVINLTLANTCAIEHVAIARLRFPMSRTNPTASVGVSVMHSGASNADSWSDAATSDIQVARKTPSFEYLALVAETVDHHGGELWPIHRQDEVLIVFADVNDAGPDGYAEAFSTNSTSDLPAALVEQRAVSCARDLLRRLNNLYYGSSREWVESQAAVLTPTNSLASRPIVSCVVDAGLVQFAMVNGTQPLLHGDVLHRMEAMLRVQQSNPHCTLLCSDRVQARLEPEVLELLFPLLPVALFPSVLVQQSGNNSALQNTTKFGCAFLADTVSVAIGELIAVSQYNEPRQHDRLRARIERLHEPHRVGLPTSGTEVASLSLIQLATVLAVQELRGENATDVIGTSAIPSWVPSNLGRKEVLGLFEDALEDLNDTTVQIQKTRDNLLPAETESLRPDLQVAVARYLPKFFQVYFDGLMGSASKPKAVMVQTREAAVDNTLALAEDGASAVVQAPW